MAKMEIPADLNFIAVLEPEQWLKRELSAPGVEPFTVGQQNRVAAIMERDRLRCISPDDAKYGSRSRKLDNYLSAFGEWGGNALVQYQLLKTRVEFHRAPQAALAEVLQALPKLDPLNIQMLEDKVTKHDQLAVLAEFGRFVSKDTAALLHPGTTSYDIVDTTRAYLFRRAWATVIRPTVCKAINDLCSLSERSKGLIQVGRTHLQSTSPVPFELTLSQYAARLADCVEACDDAFGGLRGKMSGIVGTGAGIEMVIGDGQDQGFELAVLKKLDLVPDYDSTQVVPAERMVRVGASIATLMGVLGKFTDDMRILYSTAIGEVTSRSNKESLGGSSTDATKNNPVNWENMTGKVAVVESGMVVLRAMQRTNFQRDLCSSVQARYQPQGMMAQTYEAFTRCISSLADLSVNTDRMAANLGSFTRNPGEAMVTILRGESSWVHPKYGLGHDFVKAMAKRAMTEGKPLIEVALADPEFSKLHATLPERKQRILAGSAADYVGSSVPRASANRSYANTVTSTPPEVVPGSIEAVL